MRLVTTVFQIHLQPSGFIAFIQTEARPSAWLACLKRIEDINDQLYVVSICSGDYQREGKPVCIGHQAMLYALFPPVCGVPSCFFESACGDFVRQPSIESHDQSIESCCSLASKPFCHNRSKTPASRYSWKRRWAELDEQIPVAFSAFH